MIINLIKWIFKFQGTYTKIWIWGSKCNELTLNVIVVSFVNPTYFFIIKCPMDVERGGIKYKEKWRIFIDVIILFAKKHFEKYIWTTKGEIFMFINCVFYSKTSLILFCEWKIILIDCVILYFPILLSYQFWRFCCKSLLMISALQFVYQTLVNHLLFTVFNYSLLEHFSFVL